MKRRMQIDNSKSSNNKNIYLMVFSLMVIASACTSSAFHSIDGRRNRAEIILQSRKTEKISTRMMKEEKEKEIFHSRNKMVDRRGYICLSSSIFGAIIQATLSLLLPLEASAAEEEQNDIKFSQQQQRMVFNQRPTAPKELLLPATQQRILLEKCLSLSETLMVDADKTISTIQQLKSILVDPVVRGDLNYYTPNLTFKKRNARDKHILSEYQKSDQQQLSGDVINAAMNIYTDKLKYSEEYTVQDPAWKKAYILSNGKLPDAQRLIRADMDLRVMYRNQVQINVDDAAAELYSFEYNNDNKNNMKECAVELQQLLRAATVAFNQWFDMIGDLDVKEATQTLSEGKF